MCIRDRGKTVTDADRQTNCNQFIEALYPIRVKGKWGYINRKGETVLQPQWDEADDFSDGMAKVGIMSGTEMHYGFVDQKGQWMVQPVYLNAGTFTEGFAYVNKHGLYGYVDHYGKEVIHCRFEMCIRDSRCTAPINAPRPPPIMPILILRFMV